MKGFIVVNAYTQNIHELNQPNKLKEALESFGVEMKIVRNSPAVLREEGDFCIYLDKDKYAALALEKNLRLFNRAKAIELCDDKMLTTLALDGFPMPETIPSLLCYSLEQPFLKELLCEIETKLGFPVVVKECFGSLGKQVYLAKDRAALEKISEALKSKPHLYQKYIAESSGTDLRVIVVGGKAIAAMKRIAQNDDFRSNAELGGRGEAYPLDNEARALCERVAKHLCLDYCGIDLLFGNEGYLVCEVNSNAFFGTIENVTKINIAAAYAEHIYKEIYCKNKE